MMLLKRLQKKRVTAFGIDCIARPAKAQAFDLFSSSSNIAGFKGVIEAANA